MFKIFSRINAVMGHVQAMYKLPSLKTEICINILSIQHIPGSSYTPDDLKYVMHIFKYSKVINYVFFL